MFKVWLRAVFFGYLGLAASPATSSAAEYLFEEQPLFSAEKWDFEPTHSKESIRNCSFFGHNSCLPLWTIDAGVVVLQRSNPDPGSAIIPTAGPGVISDASEFQFNGSVGPAIGIRRRLHRDSLNSVEVRYFGQLEWEATAQYGAPGNVRIGSFSNFGATDLTSKYDSSLESFEVNFLHDCTERLTLLGGFRAFEVHDTLNYTITFPAFSALYTFDAENRLYGGQAGAIIRLWDLDSPFQLNVTGKAGVYSNDAEHRFNLLPSTGGQFPGGQAENVATFVGDLSFNAVYQFTNHLSLRFGYQLLWMDGLALGSDQLILATAQASQNVIDTNGDTFYHGAIGGLELTW